MRDHKILGDKNWDEFNYNVNLFLKKIDGSKFFGSEFSWHQTLKPKNKSNIRLKTSFSCGLTLTVWTASGCIMQIRKAMTRWRGSELYN